MNERSQFKNFLLASIIFHSVVLAVLVLSFDFHAPLAVVKNSDTNMKIINAMVLDAPAGVAPPPKVIQTPQPPKVVETKLKPIVPTPPPIVKKQIKVIEPPKPKPKTIALPDPRKKQKELLQKQLLADLQKEVQQQKKIKHKTLEKAFEKEIKAQAAKSLEQQLKQEQDRLTSMESQKARGEVNKYKALILQAISQRWLIPPSINKKLTCELLIRTSPGGMVLDVQIVKTSGDVGLDRSARAAVFKASPLPVPADPNVFEPFRQFVLKMKPENIIDLSG
jgi:colicin import membrane protein